MNTEIYIECFPLDISADLSAMLNFAIDDVKDFSARSTTWSKTIVLPGTANNNKLFGHIFEIGQSNEYSPVISNVGYNFNASKSARCIIFQDHIQTFKGVLRLLQVNLTNGSIDYEVAVFGEMFGLNVALSGNYLHDLDFSAYDTLYNITDAIATWDEPAGSGVVFPLMDYGTYSTDKHHWEYGTLRPALYVKEYIDKMFTAAGYRYECALFSTARFESLIVPHNQKTMQQYSSRFLEATRGSTSLLLLDDVTTFANITFPAIFLRDFTNTGDYKFTYTGTDPITVDVVYSLNFVLSISGVHPYNWGFKIKFLKNGVEQTLQSKTITSGTAYGMVNMPDDYSINLVNGDYIQFTAETLGTVDAGSYLTFYDGSILLNSDKPLVAQTVLTDMLDINSYIPKNIKQVDFLLSIVQLFNLYVYEDRFDEKLILLKPYVDFYSTDSSDAVDWTYKLNRDKAIKIKPMSELNAKKYEYKFRSDSDYYNDLYKKRYNQGYGDYVFNSEFDFAEQTKSLELIFSATPLVGYAGEDKVYATIFKKTNGTEEKVDSNIRILQSKKITGVTSYDILNGGVTVASLTDYFYAGHFNDPDAPADDLNFGALNELFFVLTGGALNVTQFNVFYSGYMAEITNKDSKLLSAKFYLTPKDILELDFSKYVHVDGVLFRLNAIKNYNAAIPDDCEVELLKVNETIY